MPSLAPSVLHALACLRSALRTAPAQQVSLMYHALMALVGEALCGLAGDVESGRLTEVSQSGLDNHRAATKFSDVWISPKDAAQLLGHSERWLRRRRTKQPYCTFCIAGDSGRGYRVSLTALEAFMEHERLQANERVRVD